VDIALVELPLGTQSVVLVANAADDFLACLTPEQIARTWDAATAGEVNTWQTVDASFPDSELTLFAGDLGAVTPNLLLTRASGGQPLVMRADTETNNDPLYRAAAVANVPGALTYMTWGQYQAVLANNQARIQLVAIAQAGACVTPTEESLQDGSYPLSQTLSLVISQRALERAEVQAFAWYVNDPTQVADYERQNFEFITPVGLATRQVTLEDAFGVAQEAAQARQAQEAAATPVPTEEATAEVSEEAVAEVTQEATAEVTPTTGE
jgi:phosphate transport system substrate-binding protein